jgi:hypothetical protein
MFAPVFGSGHSFNDGILPEEALVSLDDYSGVVRRELGEAVSNFLSLNSVHRVFPYSTRASQQLADPKARGATKDPNTLLPGAADRRLVRVAPAPVLAGVAR